MLLAWFAYLQAAPGLVIVHLRDELDLSYSTGGLHVAAFAAGSMVAGVVSARLERALGRRTLFWSAAALMGAGAIGLTAGRVAAVTVGSVLVMGVGGGLLLVTIQAALADHHGERRAVALAEANVAASVAYVVLIGVLSLTAALHAGWRVALLASLAVPALAWWSNRRLAIDAPPPSERGAGPAPRRVLDRGRDALLHDRGRVVHHRLGRDLRRDAAGVSTDTAVALMAGYFGGVLAGRTLGSRLARRHDPARLLALALAVTAAGFAVLWPSTAPAQALAGLSLLGIGLGNLFPMGMSVAVALAPGAGGAGERTGGGDDVVRGPARAAHGRDAGGRDVADGRARGRAGRAGARRGRTHARSLAYGARTWLSQDPSCRPSPAAGSTRSSPTRSSSTPATSPARSPTCAASAATAAPSTRSPSTP